MRSRELGKMNRRQFLSGVVIMPIGMAGCLGTVDDPDTPDGLIFETQHRVGSHLVDDDLGPSGETTLLSDDYYEPVNSPRTNER